MTESIFRRMHVANCMSAIERAASLGTTGHAGLRGTLREILVTELLRPVLMPEVYVGSGQLVSLNGQLSPQVDVLLYAPSVMMPSLFGEKEGYFPIESALYAIEVKSRLTASQLRGCIANAQAIASMPLVQTSHFQPTFDQQILTERNGPTPLPIAAIFAFGSDLTSDPRAELQRYRNYDPLADTRPAIGVICIIGRGYWYFGKKWMFCAATPQFSEVMTWLSGTANTIPQLIVAKGRPKFGNYPVDGTPIVEAD